MMTPLHLRISLHYYCHTRNYYSEDPSIRILLDHYKRHLVDAGLLGAADLGSGSDYCCTEALKVYVNALCAVPLPVQQWVIPKKED